MRNWDVRLTFARPEPRLSQDEGMALWRFANGFGPLAPGSYRLAASADAETAVEAVETVCARVRRVVPDVEIEAVEAEVVRWHATAS
jgi:hypothetical protein